jgi:muramidase (phage lysozyme)
MNITSLQSALHTRNMRAFLRVIREGESSQGDDAYRTLFGGGLFGDLSKHPNRTITANGYTSTAAGAYQFLSKTWNECRDVLNLRGFTPAEQDLAAVFLIQRRGALDDVLEGRIEDAIAKCGREWASLPGSPYGQPVMTLEKAMRTYRAWRENDPEVPAATPMPPAPEKRQEAPMPAPPRPDAEPYAAAPATQLEKPDMAIPAVLTWALPILAEVVPRLGKMFGSGSAVSERNLAATTIALDVAKKAVGAANEQELIERVKADPSAAQAVRDAVDANWAKIHAAHEESIGAARQFVTAQPQRVVILNMLFHEILALVMILISAAGGITALFYTSLGNEIKSAIVTLMLIGGWNGVKEFYFGGSRGSDRKTEIMSEQQQ